MQENTNDKEVVQEKTSLAHLPHTDYRKSEEITYKIINSTNETTSLG